jgi:hypothetical protein
MLNWKLWQCFGSGLSESGSGSWHFAESGYGSRMFLNRIRIQTKIFLRQIKNCHTGMSFLDPYPDPQQWYVRYLIFCILSMVDGLPAASTIKLQTVPCNKNDLDLNFINISYFKYRTD